MIKRIINFFVEWKINKSAIKKLKIIGKKLVVKSADKIIEKEYLSIWSKLSKNPSIYYPQYFSSINGISSIKYVPENLYYGKIEPVLNNKAFALAYADKNFYEKFLSKQKEIFPKTVLRGINGVLFDSAYLKVKDSSIPSLLIRDTKYILKPATETSGGSNVVLITKTENEICVDHKQSSPQDFIRLLKNKYKGSFVLQEKIKQHPWFAEFNQSSLNTVRLFTYRSVKDEVVHPVSAVIRFGRPGSLVDNQAAGGLTCGINNNGKMNDFASEKYGITHRDFPFINSKNKTDVPYFDEMKKLAAEIAPHYGFHRLLGFDFCVDENNKVRLLEINCKNIETNFLQMNNGPLFSDFTEEIIDFCSTNKKSVVLDFYI